MSQQRKIEIDQYYHIYSRGVNKCLTFTEHEDYLRFQNYLYLCNTTDKININHMKNTNLIQNKEIVKIISYCLMPNHFHLILQQKTEGGISLFLQKVLSGYVSYVNRKYTRTGALFGSRFKDKLIDDEIYFKHLLTYIWNNPIKLLNPNYNSKDLLNGKIKLSEQELSFANSYPYKFSALGRSEVAPTEEDFKIFLQFI